MVLDIKAFNKIWDAGLVKSYGISGWLFGLVLSSFFFALSVSG